MVAASKQIRRRNHFVPVGYLAAFTDTRSTRGSIWVYDRQNPRSPKNLWLTDVGIERNLYTRETDTGVDDSAERLLADIDGPFSGIRNRLICGPAVGVNAFLSTLTAEERSTVARFMAFQLLRTPTERDATRWLGDLSSRAFLHEQLAPGGELRGMFEKAVSSGLSQEQVRSIHATLAASPRLQAGIQDWLPRTMRNAERLGALLFDFEWRLIEVRPARRLPTCDMPFVCARRGDGPGSYKLGGGVTEERFEATLTLSSSHVLYVSRAIPDEAFLKSETFAESVCTRTIAYAHRWVYSPVADESISMALATTDPPCYHVQVAGRSFPVGHPVEEIESAIEQSGAAKLQFRYGVPAER
jgi:hypothetical protein